jgi:signal transduction histidine kinase
VLGLSRLAENLLALARSDAGLAVEHTSEVDLRALVEQVAARYTKQAAERQVRIDIRGGPALTYGDTRLLSRVVGNLLENALRFSPTQGTVYAEIRNGGETTLTVRDEGPGVSPEHVPQLFTRFFRGDPARPRAEGTGLGLAIAQAGAQAHGGRIDFLGNAPGAVFRLALPALVQRADATDRNPTPIEPE